jgi:N-acetylornithine carbamoyltransferase
MRHLIDWQSLSDEVWHAAVDRALYHAERAGEWTDAARGRSIALMFFNPSLRTRTSMELAAAQMGAYSTTLTPGRETWAFAFDAGTVMDGEEAEHIREAVGVLSGYFDAIGVRLFASQKHYQQDREERLIRTFSAASSVPVINLESAFYHPCQALADAAVVRQQLGDPRGRKFVLTWAYHPRALPMAVPNSAVLMAARSGMDVVVARPEEYALDYGVMELARSYGVRVEETAQREEAYRDADVVYAKAWGGPVVYSDPDHEASLRQSLRDWCVTEHWMSRTNRGFFMHCLPVRRNVVVDDAVLDGPRAIHLQQAAFRLHAQKAILEYVWGL